VPIDPRRLTTVENRCGGHSVIASLALTPERLCLNKEHDRFRWFSIACVPANDRNPSGLFCEADSEPHRTVLLRHDDLSALGFQGRDEALRIGLEERERAVMARDDGFELEVPLHG